MVLGLLQSRTYGLFASREDSGTTVVIPKGTISPVWLFAGIGALFCSGSSCTSGPGENNGKEALLPLRMFRHRIANLGIGTQTIR
ncbi:MAG TPA: hypothetical protein VLW50_19165 [Streptosporangiaceae bacterium]|nr:hypothetical protein [Streptosporangiaceae bacterium]